MKVSIITPSYSQAQYISRTLDSVVTQVGDFELEYWVIDGQSTDGSVESIKRLAETDQRVHWLSERDSGQSNAINKGLRLVTGDIVAFLNSDDIYYPGTLQAVVQGFLAQPERQWLYGRCKIINETDHEIRRLITFYKNILGWRFSYNKLLIMNFISQPATFWRRSVLQQIGLFDEQEHLVMDYDYWCRLGQLSKPVVLPRYLAGFRYYQTSKSGQRFLQQFQDELRVAKKYTANPALLTLHHLHNYIITTCYRLLS